MVRQRRLVPTALATPHLVTSSVAQNTATLPLKLPLHVTPTHALTTSIVLAALEVEIKSP